MTAKNITADQAEASDLLRRALALMDAGDFGGLAAPHVDLALHLLAGEADQGSEAR